MTEGYLVAPRKCERRDLLYFRSGERMVRRKNISRRKEIPNLLRARSGAKRRVKVRPAELNANSRNIAPSSRAFSLSLPRFFFYLARYARASSFKKNNGDKSRNYVGLRTVCVRRYAKLAPLITKPARNYARWATD